MASPLLKIDGTLAATPVPMPRPDAASAAQVNYQRRSMAYSSSIPTEHSSTEGLDIEALRRGDASAFSTLVRQYHRTLLVVARGIVGGDEAEAVVQEAWLKAYQGIAKFEGRAKLRTWLTTIVMNEARMHLRKQPHPTGYLAPERLDSFDDRFDAQGHWLNAPTRWNALGPEEAMRSEQFGRCLADILDTLPPQQRLVLELRDVQSLELADIARQMQIAEGNVRVLLHRARARVYRAIDHYEETGQC